MEHQNENCKTAVLHFSCFIPAVSSFALFFPIQGSSQPRSDGPACTARLAQPIVVISDIPAESEVAAVQCVFQDG